MTGSAQRGGHRSRGGGWLLAAAILLIGMGTVVNLYTTFRPLPVQEPPPLPEDRPPSSLEFTPVPEPPHAAVDLPDLDSSDSWLRDFAAGLSKHPKLAYLLQSDRLIRRFVVVVDNVAEGVSPRSHVPFFAPDTDFQAIRHGDREQIDPRSYHRYDFLVDVFSSLDPQGCAELYRRAKPLLQQAYRDLGYPKRDFDDTLRRAIRNVLDTPLVEDPIELVPRVKSYRLADEHLEGLQPAQKHLLRMGRENAQKVQQKLRDLARELALDVESPDHGVREASVSHRSPQ